MKSNVISLTDPSILKLSRLERVGSRYKQAKEDLDFELFLGPPYCDTLPELRFWANAWGQALKKAKGA